MFLDNTGRVCHKWAHYFPVYENFFARFRNQSITVFEIGVYMGGSLQLWKKYFGPLATIVGIDIQPECKQFEEHECHVRIGDQSDMDFLRRVIAEFGNPDIVIDDGGHFQRDMIATFAFLFPNLKNNGVYVVEDLHTSYWRTYGGGLKKPGTFLERCKDMVDSLNAYYYTKSEADLPWLTHNLWSISFYDSMVVFEKKRRGAPYALMRPDQEGVSKMPGGVASPVNEAGEQAKAPETGANDHAVVESKAGKNVAAAEKIREARAGEPNVVTQKPEEQDNTSGKEDRPAETGENREAESGKGAL